MEKFFSGFGITRDGIWPILGWLAIILFSYWAFFHVIPQYLQWDKELTVSAEQNRRQSVYLSVEQKTEVRVLYPAGNEENRKMRSDAAPLLWSLEQMRFRGVNAGAYEGVIPGVNSAEQGRCVVYSVPNWGVRIECARPDKGMCLVEKTVPDFVGAVVAIEGFLGCSARHPLPLREPAR